MSKLEDLLAKHPNLTKPEALNIINEKNKRKKEKRTEKADRKKEKQLKNEANRPKTEVS